MTKAIRLNFYPEFLRRKRREHLSALLFVTKTSIRPDYNDLKDVFRPSHADYTYIQKYGTRDHRGGGRSSARETIARVVAGAVAKLLLKKVGVSIQAYVSRVGEIQLNKPYTELDLSHTESNIVRCPDAETANQMIARIEECRQKPRYRWWCNFLHHSRRIPAGWGRTGVQ